MMASDTPAKRPKEIQHDESPSTITDHPFRPRGEWWTRCGYPGCNLSEAAHKETTLHFGYVGDDIPEED
jgi:hypothetical protein